MSVSEVLQAVGSFSINLKQTTPRSLIENTLDYFGHIAIVPGRVNPVAIGDNLLSISRYTGVLRTKAIGDQITLEGGGMILWLGDEDEKGNVLENLTTFVTASFPNTIRGLLPSAITEGTLYSIAGTYTGTHQWQTPRAAIAYVCDVFNAKFRVNNDGTLDAGPASSLFVTNPTCVIARKGAAGRDMVTQGIPGAFETARDVTDFTTRVVLLAQGQGLDIATGSADINPILNTYKDIHGNAVVRTRLISESDTTSGNATTRAQLQLNRFTGTRNALSLSADEYDIKGKFNIGDSVWVYDPDAGLYNNSNEITHRGQRINPIALQVVETSWPITDRMTVAYRDKDGVWTDLTDYVQFETGATTLTVGDFSKQLTSSGFQPVGSRPSGDTSIPGVPTFVTPFTSAVYMDAKGFTKARISVRWSAPNNTDGSTIQDGDHYEIRYGVDTDMIYPSRWANVAVDRWQDLQTWGQPFVYPDGGLWEIAYSPWGDTSMVINDLATGVGYDFQIRAVDSSGHAGDWSPTTTSVSLQDNIPPSAPAPPTVAASMVAIQVTHTLGKASGGTFNLENDLDHLNVHVGTGADFYPDDNSTLAGRLRANSGMIIAQIPAVGSFKIDSTVDVFIKVVAVDISGNKSVPSSSVQATAVLIDDAHITDLTASKITAGTISADIIIGARFKTADTGARVELSSVGIGAWNSGGTQTFSVSSTDGSVSIIGQLSSGVSGDRVVINEAGSSRPDLRFYPSTGSNYTRLSSSSDYFSGEATFFIDSGTNAAGNANAIYEHAAGYISSSIFDNAGHADGGYVQLAQSYAQIGFDRPFANPAVSSNLLFRNDGNMVITSGNPAAIFETNGTVLTNNGSGFAFECQSLPGTNQSMRAFWNGTNICLVRNDTNAIVKTFIIDHPSKPDNYLIHATTESPHNGVEYWGRATLDEFGRAKVELPEYFEALTKVANRAVFLTPMYKPVVLATTSVRDGGFHVSGPAGTPFSWLVKAVRKDVPPLLVEPRKSDVNVYGDGPYRYYAQKEG